MANAHLEGKATVSGEQRTPCPPVARDRAEPVASTGQSRAPGTQVRIRDRYDVLLLRAALTAVLGTDFTNLVPVFALTPSLVGMRSRNGAPHCGASGFSSKSSARSPILAGATFLALSSQRLALPPLCLSGDI